MLPTPLSTPQQGGGQRAPTILRLDTPRVSGNILSQLEDSGLRSSVRRKLVGEERVRLQEELNRRILVAETAGSPGTLGNPGVPGSPGSPGSPGIPGSPGTPDIITRTTITETRLDARARDDLQTLIDQFTRIGQADGGDDDDDGGSDESRLVRALSKDLKDFANTIRDQRGDDVLGDIIGRIERSVIGEGGLEFADLFRDPKLFLDIAAGLIQFSDDTNKQAATALRDIILRIGDRRLTDDNPNNDNLRPIGAAIDRLGRALDNEPDAVEALQDFLNRLPDGSTGGGNGGGSDLDGAKAYARRIAGILDETLDTLNLGSTDQESITRLQSTIVAIRNLDDIDGGIDDQLRDRAVEGLEDILARNVTTTTRIEETVTPGDPAGPAVPATPATPATPAIPAVPATPPTPPSRSQTILEETTLVPKVEIAYRVVAVYQAVQDQLEPLRKLGQSPPAAPNLQGLVSVAAGDADGSNRFGLSIRQDDQTGLGRVYRRTASGGLFDSRI